MVAVRLGTPSFARLAKLAMPSCTALIVLETPQKGSAFPVSCACEDFIFCEGFGAQKPRCHCQPKML